eukprot:scaffold73411_cov31-Tisochrysis_lutea.AAC.4
MRFHASSRLLGMMDHLLRRGYGRIGTLLQPMVTMSACTGAVGVEFVGEGVLITVVLSKKA